MRTHSLSDQQFDELCAGPVTVETMTSLKDAQYSVRKLRLIALLQVIPTDSDWSSRWDRLAEAEDEHPDVMRDILMYPPVGVWLVKSLRSRSDLGYFDRLLAAVQTGIPGTRHQVTADDIELDVIIDDSDPYREFAEWLAPAPLDPAELAAWRRLLDEAWNLLAKRHRPYALELSAGLRAVIPIVSGRKVAGASSRAAFGGVALSKKDSGAELAEVLIHELQHSKVNAVLDLVSLQESESGRMFYALWRTDPRPVLGVLHGIYAFASVVEFWHVERQSGRAAEFAFVYRKLQVLEAVEQLRNAPELTGHGRRLVEAAAQRMAACDESAVDPEVLDLAVRLVDDNRTTWQLRHREYDRAAVDALATAWLDRSAAPKMTMVFQVKAGVRTTSAPPRLAMLRAKALRQQVSYPDGPDTAYVQGDHDRARAGYLARIREHAEDLFAWAGLAMTLKSFRPDVTFAVYKAIRDRQGDPPDPVDLAAWMDSQLHGVGVAVRADRADGR